MARKNLLEDRVRIMIKSVVPLARDDFNNKNSEAIDIGFFCQLTTNYVFWSHVATGRLQLISFYLSVGGSYSNCTLQAEYNLNKKKT